MGSLDTGGLCSRRKGAAFIVDGLLKLSLPVFVPLLIFPIVQAAASNIPVMTNTTLTVSGSDPYSMSCSVTGPAISGNSGPTGTVTFTDTTTGQTLATGQLGASSQAQGFAETYFNSQGGQLFIGDFNGDGIPDVLAYQPAQSDPGNTEVLVFLGNGDGSFQAPKVTSIYSSTEYSFYATGDFNGDGKTDIVLGDEEGLTIAVFFGNGDGTFQTSGVSTSERFGTSEVHVSAGDFNGDGVSDLAVLSDGVTTAAILLGKGDGTFQTPQNIPIASGFSGYAIRVGDFNQDGKLDLVAAQLNPGGIWVSLGNGDGTFQSPVEIYSEASIQIEPGFFNNDGHLDLAVDLPGGGISILLGNGDGTFQAGSGNMLPIWDAGANQPILVGDFAGNGKLGIATGFCGGLTTNLCSIASYANNGNATFQAPSVFQLPIGGNFSGLSAVSADFNGDGAADLALISNFSLYVFINSTMDRAAASASNVVVAPGTNATHNLQCSYSGDNNYPTSTSPTVTETFSAAATPLFSLQVGAYTSAQTVSITDASPGSTIYYTSDGTTPTSNSTQYTGPISVASTTTLKAIAAGTTYLASPVSEVVYTVTAAPSISLPSGTYPSGQTVTLTDSTGGASIYYTVDGSAPSANSNLYTAPVPVAGAMILNAIALAPGSLFSTVSSATYTAPVGSTSTTLQPSTTSGNENQQITLTANVSGTAPTGTVTFATSTATLGTAQIANGTATLQTSFANSGTYSVTATYAGDARNAGSASTAVTINIAAPSYTLGSSATSQTLSPGQSATFTITLTPAGGFTGAVNFSCSGLPGGAACSFLPASLTPSGAPETTTLTITTTSGTSAWNTQSPQRSRRGALGAAVTLAGIFGLMLVPYRVRKLRMFLLACFLVPGTALGVLWLSSCGGGGSSGGSQGGGNSGTPAGTYTVSVNGVSSSGSTSTALQISLVVQ